MTSSRFGEQRAVRFSRALAQYPGSRSLELLPLLALAWPEEPGRVAVELGAGSGYLSSVLDRLYGRVVRVDQSRAMLSTATASPDEEVVDELLFAADRLDHEVAPDLVVSLATFHHVCALNGDAVDHPASHALQRNTIAAWVQRLRPGGRFVIVDVGAPSPPLDDYLAGAAGRFDAAGLDPVPWTLVKKLDQSLNGYHLLDAAEEFELARDGEPLSLAGIAESYRAAKLAVDPVGPVDFFDHLVEERSVEGHDAHFLDEPELGAALRDAGLGEVVTGVLPTPWPFPHQRGAYWFVNELFGLGGSAGADDRAGASPEMVAQIDRYLRVRPHRSRSIVEWQLLYATGVKP
jgi:SAM-dependent methyltransferase